MCINTILILVAAFCTIL